MEPILYAEDEENDVFFLQLAFRDAGVTNPLQVVNNGQQAIDYLSGIGAYADRDKHPLPRLVLLDMKMPAKSGLEVLKWIRTTPAFSTLPVIMLTSSSTDADIHRAYIQGANGYLAKPGNPDQMLKMVIAIKDFWLLQNRTALSAEGASS
jgi:CheY-like chemotaxis protein